MEFTLHGWCMAWRASIHVNSPCGEVDGPILSERLYCNKHILKSKLLKRGMRLALQYLP